MIKLRKYRRKVQGLADLLNYAAVIDNGVVLLKSGALMASWQYIGPDNATLTFDELNTRSARINNALHQLGTGWMTQHDVFRLKSSSYPDPSECFFPDPVTRAIDDERRELYTAGTHHENIMVVTLTYLPPTLEKTRITAMMIDGEEKFEIAGVGKKHLDKFKLACNEFEGTMSSVCRMYRLFGHDRVVDIHGTVEIQDDQLSYINHCITGNHHPINLPPIPMYLDAVLGGQEFFTGLRPLIGDKYLGAICIEGFPAHSFPGILEGLEQHQFEYRWNNRFIYEDPEAAKKALNRYRLKWQQKKRGFVAQLTQNHNAPVDRFAEEMEMQTEQSISEASSGQVLYGYYTSTIIIMDKDQEHLQDGLDSLKNYITNLGFACRIESINTVEAYLGSLPGHAVENLRRPMIHTLNLADLLPTSAIWPGQQYCPCPFYPPQSPPLVISSTTGNTPFRLNLHIHDTGHTLVFGPPGSGKSTLLATMAAQFRKYRKAKIFVFDMGYAMYPLCAAIPGANHYDIGEDEAVEFCPLANLETDAQQAWAEEWIIAALKLQNIDILPDKRNAVKTALYQHRKSADKSLHDFVVNLQHRELSQALERYIVNDVQNSAILDAEEDKLALSDFNVFELYHLMEMGEDMVLPVLTYLFRKVELALEGQPTMIILDEAWIPLGHQVFRDKIRGWLKTLRKHNAIIIMATQNISDAANSGILDVIDDSAPTKIYLPNATAKDEETSKLYRSLGLNAREIDLISRITPKRDYYFRNPEGRRLFDLKLGPLTLSFVGAAGKKDLAKIRELEKHHGQDWVTHWLKYRGIEA